MKDSTITDALSDLTGIKTWAGLQDTVGYSDSFQHCPIANWLAATVVGIQEVGVCGGNIRLTYQDGQRVYLEACEDLQELETMVDASEYETDEAIPSAWLMETIERLQGVTA